MPTPPILCLRFAAYLTIGLAQDSRPSGSLVLTRKALSSFTPCRFIPAHKNPHYAQMYGPPPDCKRFEDGRRDSLRKCIRPLPRNSHSEGRVFRLQLQQREIPTSRRSI